MVKTILLCYNDAYELHAWYNTVPVKSALQKLANEPTRLVVRVGRRHCPEIQAKIVTHSIVIQASLTLFRNITETA